MFIILSVLKVREKIVEAIPLGIRLGIAPAIGLMLLNIGIGSNAGVYSSDGGPFYVMRDFFGALTPSLAKANMGDGYPQMVLTVVTMFVGLFLIVLFAHKKIKGSVLLGMLCASGIYWAGEAIFLHTNPFASLKGASFVPAFGDMAETTLFKFDAARAAVNIERVVADVQHVDKAVGIVDVRLHAVGHQHADDILATVGRHAQRRRDGAVLAARNADDGGKSRSVLFRYRRFLQKGSCGYFIMFGPRAQGLPNGLPLAAGAKADAERGAAACVCARGMVKSGKAAGCGNRST